MIPTEAPIQELLGPCKSFHSEKPERTLQTWTLTLIALKPIGLHRKYLIAPHKKFGSQNSGANIMKVT
jgi:hypothetical protein